MRRALLVFAALVLATPADARPGGGHSFSSGSHSYSSHSYSSGGSSYHPSYHGSYGSSGGSSSYGSSGGSSTPSDDEAYERTRDQAACMGECIGRAWMLTDGGQSDEKTCELDCVARKATERATARAAAAKAVAWDVHPSQPPLMRRFLPFTLFFGFVAMVAGIGWSLRRRKEREWSTWAEGVDDAEQGPVGASVTEGLAAVGLADADFSRVLFEDFLYALYAEVHTARGGGKLARLGPYLEDRARASLEKWPADAVEAIVVGSATLRELREDPGTHAIRAVVDFETNYTEKTVSGAASYYAREQWVLERLAGAKSRPPHRARVIGCASCGAPLDKLVGGTCSYCGAAAAGAVDWRVVDVVVAEREARGPILTGTTEEVGTDLPTRVAADVKTRWAELAARDPAVTWASLSARIEHVFRVFHRTWTAQDLAEARPLLSDMLFETQRYWVAAYKAQGLRNVTEDATILTIQLSKLTRDTWFDAVTVRVFATCKDYTLDAAGNVVGGHRDRERRYSEYWTFLRSAKRAGAPKADSECPSCGAPFGKIGMSGKCGSCGAKITTGDFDWILSRIEQDEVYEL